MKKEHTQLENKLGETMRKVGEHIKQFGEFVKYVERMNE